MASPPLWVEDVVVGVDDVVVGVVAAGVVLVELEEPVDPLAPIVAVLGFSVAWLLNEMTHAPVTTPSGVTPPDTPWRWGWADDSQILWNSGTSAIRSSHPATGL